MNLVEIRAKDSLPQATEVLKGGGILVFPTDTVYGMGCLMNKKAIRKLYKIKNRPSSQPTALLLSKKQYDSFCSNTKSHLNISEKIKKDFLSGRATVIFPANYFNIQIPKIIIHNGTVGIRLPDYPWLKKLIDKAGPIVASSANKKGESPPKNFGEISPGIITKVDLVIKTDEMLTGKPSTIYDLKSGVYLRD